MNSFNLREDQLDVVRQIRNTSTKFVFLQAPVGSGKSYIARELASHYKRAAIVTTQLKLQDQYMSTEDLLTGMGSLRGKSHYFCKCEKNCTHCEGYDKCELFSQCLHCVNFPLATEPMSEKQCEVCSYIPYIKYDDECASCKECEYGKECDKYHNAKIIKKQRYLTYDNNCTVYNVHSFYYNHVLARDLPCGPLVDDPELLIVDEAHLLPSVLLSITHEKLIGYLGEDDLLYSCGGTELVTDIKGVSGTVHRTTLEDAGHTLLKNLAPATARVAVLTIRSTTRLTPDKQHSIIVANNCERFKDIKHKVDDIGIHIYKVYKDIKIVGITQLQSILAAKSLSNEVMDFVSVPKKVVFMSGTMDSELLAKLLDLRPSEYITLKVPMKWNPEIHKVNFWLKYIDKHTPEYGHIAQLPTYCKNSESILAMKKPIAQCLLAMHKAYNAKEPHTNTVVHCVSKARATFLHEEVKKLEPNSSMLQPESPSSVAHEHKLIFVWSWDEGVDLVGSDWQHQVVLKSPIAPAVKYILEHITKASDDTTELDSAILADALEVVEPSYKYTEVARKVWQQVGRIKRGLDDEGSTTIIANKAMGAYNVGEYKWSNPCVKIV